MLCESSVTALILDIARIGRDPTDTEIAQIRADVAAAGFDPCAVSRAGLVAQGAAWAGRTIRSNERLSVAVAHYLRHVVAGQEWPAGTTLDDYAGSLRGAVSDPDSGIYLSRYMGVWSLAFLARSDGQRGPAGGEWILVEYRPEYGYWVTGFQPGDGLAHLASGQRTNGRWLRRPS
jgi:hypothetical protein